ncbi:hypothetical protein EDD22DRAFT_948246 [Suillus occidentalis]|nr:hypothetical protein EDD22DRAFT_948246 [Suillus occidentalis]
MNAEEPTTTATAPFDNLDGDVILRSITDRVDFHTFKVILSLMSPVFKDMFTLPQNDLQSNVPSIPVIPVTESSTTLKPLLLLCYPAATPTFDSLNNAKAVMEAAKKYDMQAALSRAGDLAMSLFLPTHFLDLYALSCRFGWQHHAQTAATKSLEIKNLGRPSTKFENMHDITALDHHRLLTYHHACGVAAQAVGNSLSWLDPWVSIKNMAMWSPPSDCVCKGLRKMLPVANFGELKIASWFDVYLVLSGKELWERPCVSTIKEFLMTYSRAVSSASDCAACRRMAVVEDMVDFHTMYIAQVEKVVANVNLETS